MKTGDMLLERRKLDTALTHTVAMLALLAVALAVIWWWNPAPEVAQRIHQIALGGLK